MTVADDCAELATLAPMLGPALTRDNTHTGRGRPIAPLNLYNTDVLIARITLEHEIPAAAIRSAELLHEHWQVRNIRVSLIALPRFAARMHDLDLVTEHRQLTLLTAGWLRLTKQALGLATRPQALRLRCPYCQATLQIDPGTEGFMNPRDLTEPPEWKHVYCAGCGTDGAHVWCPGCGTHWPQARWDLLLHILEQAARADASR